MRPVVLDFDRSVPALPGEMRLDMGFMEDTVRLCCRRDALRAVQRRMEDAFPEGPVTCFLGSGDFHHVALTSIRRHDGCAGLDVVVFDNHPDNMRQAFGVHCGSWVGQAARLPFVASVDVVGITSPDVSGAKLCSHDLVPLWRGKLRYWCIGADASWAGRLGVKDAVRSFDTAAAMLDGFAEHRRRRDRPVYLSVDKDVLSARVVSTNWDQGVLEEQELLAAIASVKGPVMGADVTGEISAIHHASGWKRLLSALDGQTAVDESSLPASRERHRGVNQRLLHALSVAGRPRIRS